jgi:hypothetical protein
MTAIQSPLSRRQNEALGELLAELEQGRQTWLRIAQKFKACRDLGVEVEALKAKGLTAGLIFRLEALADGRLLPEANQRLLGNEIATKVFSELPELTQRRFLSSGVPVWRDGAEAVVPVEDLRPGEARRLIDPGSKRVLEPAEQAARAEPVPVRRDKLLRLGFSPDQYNDIARQAKRAGLSPVGYLLAELVKAGVVNARRRGASA